MLGQIKFENYERCYPKRLKKFFQANINYLDYDKYIPKMDRAVVGNIPKEIINLFTDNKPEKIKSFQEALADIAVYIRKNRHFMDKEKFDLFHFEMLDQKKVKELDKKATSRFNQKIKRLLPKGVQAELNLENYGGFANVYRFSLKRKSGKKLMHDKALKVFYNIEEPLLINKPYHNNYAEANFWIFLKKWAGHKLDNTQFTKHYISDMKSGYYMTEFIDEYIPKTTKKLSLKKLLGIVFDDVLNNKPINGKLYDGGGFKKISTFIDDNVVRKNYKKIINRNTENERRQVIANLEKLAENPKTPFKNKILKAVQIYKIQQEKQFEKQKNSNKGFIESVVGFFQNIQIRLIDYFGEKGL